MADSQRLTVPKKGKSAVWKHFKRYEDNGIALVNVASCTLCKPTKDVSYAGNPSNLWRHLLSMHNEEFYKLRKDKKGKEGAIQKDLN